MRHVSLSEGEDWPNSNAEFETTVRHVSLSEDKAESCRGTVSCTCMFQIQIFLSFNNASSYETV